MGFSDSAIVLESGGDNIDLGQLSGAHSSGTQAIPNGQGLNVLGSSVNTIGCGQGGAGNVISGNTGNGILIQPAGTHSSANLIVGNLIGTTADGFQRPQRGSGIASPAPERITSGRPGRASAT